MIIKEKRKMLKTLKEAKNKLQKNIKKLFEKDNLDKLARETGFVKRRSSQLKGSEVVEILTVDMLDNPNMSYELMCDRIEEINPGVRITMQSLEERINKQETVKYIKTILEQAIEEKLSNQENVPYELLGKFSEVEVRDSTIIQLNKKLANEFKGSGGSASKSSLKVDFVYSLKYHKVTKITIHEGNRPDQALSNDGSHHSKPGDLQIADLGYFSLERFKSLDLNGVFYLSRLLSSVNVYLYATSNEQIDLTTYLNKHFSNQNVVNLTVYIGVKERLPVRLVAYRLQQEVVSERKRKANKKAKNKGRTLSKKSRAWLEFSFFITNVPVQIWEAKIVGTIYRVRWQIELIFKNWKSLLNIHILKGNRSERIQCIIYARLLSIVLITNICSYIAIYAQHWYKKLVSFHKVIAWILTQVRFQKFIYHPNKMLSDIEYSLPRLCMQKRKRKTTMELIELQVDYFDSQPPYTY